VTVYQSFATGDIPSYQTHRSSFQKVPGSGRPNVFFFHWIGLRENLQETHGFYGFYGFYHQI